MSVQDHAGGGIVIFNIISRILLKGLGPLDGWKTWVGIALAIIDGIAQFYDVVPATLPTGLTEVIPSILVGLGLGDKMGKERAEPAKK